ncbi:MAG: hypothetical protein JRI91_07810 [Deltaproteobacteria bacterium]|nr:hypothetical protein [Deltaproteobacteria bacterium]
MEKEQEKSSTLSRRNFMTKAGIFLAGGITGCASLQLPEARPKNEPPPLPWPWAKLDPMEAGRRAYRGYLTKPGG